MRAGPPVAFAALLATPLLTCGRTDCPQPSPLPIMHALVGDPCGTDGNCVPGLSCWAIYPVAGYDSPSFTANACTVPCGTGCPPGAACAMLPAPQRDGGVETFGTCLRACASDDDCRQGLSAGRCQSGACVRLQCTDAAQCPAGYSCEIPAIVCCPRGGKCAFAGPVPGYCRRP